MKKIVQVIFTLFLSIVSLLSVALMMPSLTIKAYAANQGKEPYLKSIYISEGDNLDFSKDIHTYFLDLRKDIDEIYIKAKPYDNDDTVKINDIEVTKDGKYKQKFKLQEGKNKFVIEVKDDDKDVSTYTVYVYCGGKNAVYLKNVTIDGNNIGFARNNTFYNLELEESEILSLETTTEGDEYSVYINGQPMNDKNAKKLKFNGIGKYTINLSVIDNETDRSGNYTLNIYLGIPIAPNVSDSINSVIKPSQWVIVNGAWHYNDAMGHCLKDIWFYDSKYNCYFHFNNRGIMQTGWINDGGNTYYLGLDGRMQTEWVYYKDKWYYLDLNGVMRTGWIKYKNKWYYLNEDGSMAKGWIVVNNKWYYLDYEGTMKTGWILYYKKLYYLGDDGDMKIGWAKIDNEWYYFNNDGSIKSGEWVYYNRNWYYINYIGTMRCGWLYRDNKYYYLNEDGTMRTSPKTIDGYLYNFNADGSVKFD